MAKKINSMMKGKMFSAKSIGPKGYGFGRKSKMPGMKYGGK